jgi:23S rRNA (guanosine2251-2'-O)-methyltransferase
MQSKKKPILKRSIQPSKSRGDFSEKPTKSRSGTGEKSTKARGSFPEKPVKSRSSSGEKSPKSKGSFSGKSNQSRSPLSDRTSPARGAFRDKTARPKDSPTEKKEFSSQKRNPLVNAKDLKVKKEYAPPKELYIWGRRPIESYFASLHLKDNSNADKHSLHIIVDKSNKAPAQLKSIVESAKTLGISILSHSSAEAGWPLAESTDLNHQRVCLKIPQYPVSDIEDVIEIIKEEYPSARGKCLGVVLDQIQDPRNFGAILRSAAFFGAKFVVYATDRQSDIGGLVLKTSAGGAFSLKLTPVVNINRAMAKLKEAGAWIVGTTLEERSVEFSQLPRDRNWVLVLGNEGKGLRMEVAKNCDYLVKIPGGDSSVDSLNVSVAAGICLHQFNHSQN